MSHCVQIIVDDPHSKREMGAGSRECVQCVGVPVGYQLSRRVAGCPRFWTKFSGSSGSGFSPLFTPWLPSALTIPTRQFSSLATTGIGEFSPRTCTVSNMYGVYFFKCLYFRNVQNLQQTQGVKCS